MSRLLKDRLQQHSTPGVLLYDQIESVTLVDAKWTQSVQTPNPVATGYIYIYSNNELTLHVLFLFNINYAN